jgi:hypothetical protein
VMRRACKPFQIKAVQRGWREPVLRGALPKQSTAYRRSYLVENHQGTLARTKPVLAGANGSRWRA